VQNVAVDTDHAGNIQPSKQKSTERIDGVSALVMALDAMHRDQAAPTAEPELYIFSGPS
jgi:phage terminase large subunit-like protein